MATGIIGKGLLIRGELHGEDDLVIEGTVEGTIAMKQNLTIEASGKILANIETENITVMGEVEGDLTARDKITIHSGARVIGDIKAPRIELDDGAYYKGNIVMTG